MVKHLYWTRSYKRDWTHSMRCWCKKHNKNGDVNFHEMTDDVTTRWIDVDEIKDRYGNPTRPPYHIRKTKRYNVLISTVEVEAKDEWQAKTLTIERLTKETGLMAVEEII